MLEFAKADVFHVNRIFVMLFSAKGRAFYHFPFLVCELVLVRGFLL